MPLDYDTSRETSKISLELRVSAKLACKQERCPILFYHGGGPSSYDNIVELPLADDFEGMYNTISIAQRGIGESESWDIYKGDFASDVQDGPWMSISESYPLGKSPNNKIINEHPQKACSTVLPGSNVATPKRTLQYLDPVRDQAEIGEYFRYMQSTLANCVGNDYWKIAVPGETYSTNFLEWVGTHFLGRDMDRLRKAFGAEKLSCYGFSYGTGVCANYAASFPDRIGLFTANGNVDYPGTTNSFQVNVADAFEQLSTKLLEICRDGYGKATCVGNPEVSASEVLGAAIDEARNNPRFTLKTADGDDFPFPVGYIYNLLQGVRGGDATQSTPWIEALDSLKGTVEWINEVVALTTSDDEAEAMVTESANALCGVDWNTTGMCEGGPKSSMNEDTAINSMDYAGRFGWQNTLTKTVALLRGEYPPFAVHAAINNGPQLMMYPLQPTPCMYGYRAGVKGIIINSLYDGATPYVNAKTMRGGMSDTRLVTWQGVGHCVYSTVDYDPDGVAACLRHVDAYFKSGGEVLPIDGSTCLESQHIRKSEESSRGEHNEAHNRRLQAAQVKKEL